jgi:hypothetical protein
MELVECASLAAVWVRSRYGYATTRWAIIAGGLRWRSTEEAGGAGVLDRQTYQRGTRGSRLCGVGS